MLLEHSVGACCYDLGSREFNNTFRPRPTSPRAPRRRPKQIAQSLSSPGPDGTGKASWPAAALTRMSARETARKRRPRVPGSHSTSTFDGHSLLQSLQPPPRTGLRPRTLKHSSLGARAASSASRIWPRELKIGELHSLTRAPSCELKASLDNPIVSRCASLTRPSWLNRREDVLTRGAW